MTSISNCFEALCPALDDEYKARATYRAVIGRFGPGLFTARGWTPPADRWNGQVVAPDSLADAFRAGVEAEVDNVALYDRLDAMTDDTEIVAVFTALRQASAERHLPAFQRHMDGCGGGGRHHHH